MYDPLVKQYGDAFGIERKEKRKRFFRRLRHYKIYGEIYGKRRAQNRTRKLISQGKL